MGQMNVESFNLDHRTVLAPYVRVADTKSLPGGDVITKYDVRFCQPNRDHLPMPTVHSLEHTMAEKIRDHVDNVIDVGPMGCQTGFYVTVVNQDALGGMPAFLDTLATTLQDVADATEVPAANETQCGWAASHDLAGAQAAARAMLERRSEWEQDQA
ncbi:S-ribosylhomocysteine lyase [Aestuariimicrobium sp. p3-SID1156]|uniref:S-ribosylhomocysteine lyase n=1 Tax=Aestuariimicrobium sp. p3-SID1156 TaxID=2916038 RepID=UPI00223A76AD|nr:S-ribosylhomocysteine lyase [Aestuariimicrobium sp. p3-SID1156]MCT1459325.1 S-ribosylhomocysteine lyase [Aestuariimicrobium sp. p3-SID1156]